MKKFTKALIIWVPPAIIVAIVALIPSELQMAACFFALLAVMIAARVAQRLTTGRWGYDNEWFWLLPSSALWFFLAKWKSFDDWLAFGPIIMMLMITIAAGFRLWREDNPKELR